MSEQTDIFNALGQIGRSKRQSNTKTSRDLLVRNGFKFESFNNGVMIRLCGYDFYPSTGLFLNRKTKTKGRGVFNLMRILKKERK
jgi:hypothetical protein